MKKFNKQFKSGFTLIELLIVIALLGALAIGLLATVDPFEQLKKGTDTSTRNTTSEIYNSVIRYYAVKNKMPWTDLAGLTAMALSDISMTDPGNGYLSKVISAGELKPDFISLAGGALSKIRITSTGDGVNPINQVSVCFLPDSKSFGIEGNAKYSSSGALQTDNCKSIDSTSPNCYWCIE